jgi:hypothetical protein
MNSSVIGGQKMKSVLLLTIYTKSDQEDIDVNEILGILAEFDE